MIACVSHKIWLYISPIVNLLKGVSIMHVDKEGEMGLAICPYYYISPIFVKWSPKRWERGQNVQKTVHIVYGYFEIDTYIISVLFKYWSRFFWLNYVVVCTFNIYSTYIARPLLFPILSIQIRFLSGCISMD